MKDNLTVLGVDESMTCSGLSVVQNGIPGYVDTVRLVSAAAGTNKGPQLIFRIKKLYGALDKVCDEYDVDVLACERTDWMRSLKGRTDWAREYAIERHNQEALALLQGALCAYAIHNNLEFMLLGVNEWRRELGYGNTKEHVQEMLAVEFPNKFRKSDGLYWREDDTKVDHNASDATGIALVAYHRVNQERKVMA